MLGGSGEKKKGKKDKEGKKDKAKKDGKKSVAASPASTPAATPASPWFGAAAEEKEKSTAKPDASGQLPATLTGNMMVTGMTSLKSKAGKAKQQVNIRHVEAQLKREHRWAVGQGADLAQELMEAHAAAVANAKELERTENQVKRGAKGMLTFELIEAKQLCAEARDALRPAEDLYQTMVGEESSVRQSLASAESTSQQVASLEQRMEEDAHAQQQQWVDRAELELTQQREDCEALEQQEAQLHRHFTHAVHEQEIAAQELATASHSETKAHQDLKLASAERRRFQQEAHTEDKAAERARQDLKFAKSKMADQAAKENVLTCMIDALEADAEDAGKAASAEEFEAQQFRQLLHAEVDSVNQLEGECERLRREIRDLSRLNRSKLLEL